MKNLNELAVAVTNLDTGKGELNISQTKRVVKCLAKLMAADSSVSAMLLNYGIRQQKPEVKNEKVRRKFVKSVRGKRG